MIGCAYYTAGTALPLNAVNDNRLPHVMGYNLIVHETSKERLTFFVF